MQYGMAIAAQDLIKNNPDVAYMDRANNLHNELTVNAPEQESRETSKKSRRRKGKRDDDDYKKMKKGFHK